MVSLPWISCLCQGWRRSQIKTFAALWQAFAHAASPLLSRVAFQLTLQTRIGLPHTLKRVARFLRNPRIDEARFYRNVVAFLWPRVQRWRWVPIAVDWTYCERHEPWQCLVASLVLRGRGIPLLIWCFPRDDFGPYETQSRVEEAFLEELRRILPPQPAPVILADRGFARASLLRHLQQLGLDFVVRLRWKVTVELEGQRKVLGDIPVARGQVLHWRQVRYHAAGHVVVPQLVLTRPAQEKPRAMDPWMLATSLSESPERIIALYAKRMTIEEDFRTAKTDLGWKECRIRTLAHYRRFVLLMVATLLFALLLGIAAERAPALARGRVRRRQGIFDSSLTRVGLQLLRTGFGVLIHVDEVVRLPEPW